MSNPNPPITVTKTITEATDGRVQREDGTWERAVDEGWEGHGVDRHRVVRFEPARAPRTVPYRTRVSEGVLEGRVSTEIGDCMPTSLTLSAEGTRAVVEGMLAVRAWGGPSAIWATRILRQLNVQER